MLNEKGEFEGTLIIDFEVTRTTNAIHLHAQGLTIDTASVKSDATNIITPTTPPSGDRVILTLKRELTKGSTDQLTILYTGSYKESDLEGFYSFKHKDETSYIGLTQFGTTAARRVFPCLDQPDKKAKFTITMNYDTGYTVHSNTEKDNPTSPLPKKTIAFKTTKKISPHVVAWAVTKYSAIPTSDPRISVWHRGTLSPTLLGVTANVVPKVYTQLQNDLTDYLLLTEKLNLFVVGNTKFSGMENIGLPIFREAAITFEDGESASDDRQRICQLVTHELAQQWFGALVTPKWWDEVWLSEGFATYFEYFALAEVETAWEMTEQFVVQQTQAAMQADWYSGAYTATHEGKHIDLHPLIIQNVKTTEDINRVFNFDPITSSKGASVLRMLYTILGGDTFKKNLKKYLSDKAESNVDTADLWEKMGASLPPETLLPTGLKLAEVMDKWATQPGFPEIVVTRDYAAANVKLTQSPFLLPPHKAVGKPTWNVPIFWTTEKDPAKNNLDWLQAVSGTAEIKLPSLTDKQWLLINKDQVGFYRVNYDKKNWQLLSDSFLKLSTSSRAMLLDDALNLARGGRLGYVTALQVTALLSEETEFAPWSAALNSFSYLYDRLSNEVKSRVVIEKYILEKLTDIYHYIGGFDISPSDPHVRLLMKQRILHWACRVGHASCIKTAQNLFKSWTNTPLTTKIKPDLRRVSYCTGIQRGNKTDFDLLKTQYKTSTDPDKPRIVYALGCSNDTDLLKDYLKDSITITPIPPKTFTITGRQVFTAVCQNPIGVQLALKFLIADWEEASKVWKLPQTEGETEVSKAFSEDLAPKLNTPAQLKELKDFLAVITKEKIKEGVELAIGTLEDTLVWQKNHRDEVIRALEEETTTTAITTTTTRTTTTTTRTTTTPTSTTTTRTTTTPTTTTPTTTTTTETTTTPPVGAASSIHISVFLIILALFITI